jgi:hypothetical protein
MGGAVSLRISGTEKWQKTAQAMAKASRDLMPWLREAAAESLEPLKHAIRHSAINTLPTRGGVDRKIANSDMRIVQRRHLVRLEARNAYSLGRIDKGILRHPVPRTNKWVNQPVRKGWFTKPTEDASPRIQREIEHELRRIIERIGR